MRIEEERGEGRGERGEGRGERGEGRAVDMKRKGRGDIPFKRTLRTWPFGTTT